MLRHPWIASLLVLMVPFVLAGTRAKPVEKSVKKRAAPLKLEVPLSAVEQDNVRIEAHIQELEAAIAALQKAKGKKPAPVATPATQPATEAPATQPSDPRTALEQAKAQNARLRRELGSLIRQHATLRGRPVAERLKKAGPLRIAAYCNEPDGINHMERDFGEPARLVGAVGDHLFYEWRILHKGLEEVPPERVVIRADFNPNKKTRRAHWVHVFVPADKAEADQVMKSYIDTIQPPERNVAEPAKSAAP